MSHEVGARSATQVLAIVSLRPVLGRRLTADNKSLKLTGERTFEDVFHDMIMRVLPLKKGTSVADRTVKFIAGYTKFITEKSTSFIP